jgi:serine/threonine protein kinase
MEYVPKLKENRKGRIRHPGSKTIEGIVGKEDPKFSDFLEKCTSWKTSERLTPSDALAHPWI